MGAGLVGVVGQVKLKILLDNDTQVDLSGVDQEKLEIALDQRTMSGIDSNK